MIIDFIPMTLKNYVFNVHLGRLFKIASRFFSTFPSICFIKSRLKVEEILDFSTFLDIAKLK